MRQKVDRQLGNLVCRRRRVTKTEREKLKQKNRWAKKSGKQSRPWSVRQTETDCGGGWNFLKKRVSFELRIRDQYCRFARHDFNMTSLYYAARDHQLQISCPRESSPVITAATQILLKRGTSRRQPIQNPLLETWSNVTNVVNVTKLCHVLNIKDKVLTLYSLLNGLSGLKSSLIGRF